MLETIASLLVFSSPRGVAVYQTLWTSVSANAMIKDYAIMSSLARPFGIAYDSIRHRLPSQRCHPPLRQYGIRRGQLSSPHAVI